MATVITVYCSYTIMLRDEAYFTCNSCRDAETCRGHEKMQSVLKL